MSRWLAGRRLAPGLSLAAAVLAGCATPLTVTPLATGQLAVQAFELRGDDPERLRNEAARLCGGTGDVLRESQASRTLPPPDDSGRLARGWHVVMQTLNPPMHQSQLMVRCHARPERQQVVATYNPAPVAAEAEGSWFKRILSWRPWTAAAPKPAEPDADVPYGF